MSKPAKIDHAGNAQTPPDLATVIAAWPTLPEPIKAGIVAMVSAAGAEHGQGQRQPARRERKARP